jgi:hypothetical protein
MADTLPNISLPRQTWVNLYGESGLTIGVQILAQNIGVCDISLASQENQPTDESATQIIKRSQQARNDFGDLGAWAFCNNSDGLINVRIAP